MSLTIETVPLTETVGVEIRGVDADMLVNDPEIPEVILDTLEANGVLVFRELHLDDETQVAFSKRLGKVEIFPGEGKLPEIFIVTLDANRNPIAVARCSSASRSASKRSQKASPPSGTR